MARPYWSWTNPDFAYQSPAGFFTATESKSQISFHQISRSTGERIRHQKVLQSAAESDESSPAVKATITSKATSKRKGQYVHDRAQRT